MQTAKIFVSGKMVLPCLPKSAAATNMFGRSRNNSFLSMVTVGAEAASATLQLRSGLLQHQRTFWAPIPSPDRAVVAKAAAATNVFGRSFVEFKMFQDVSINKAKTNGDPQIIPGHVGYRGRFGARTGGGRLSCVGTGGEHTRTQTDPHLLIGPTTSAPFIIPTCYSDETLYAKHADVHPQGTTFSKNHQRPRKRDVSIHVCMIDIAPKAKSRPAHSARGSNSNGSSEPREALN